MPRVKNLNIVIAYGEIDFDEYMTKIWQKEGKYTNVQQDTTEPKS